MSTSADGSSTRGGGGGWDGGRDADFPAGAKSPAICLGDDSVRRGGTEDLLELAMAMGSLRTTVISVSETSSSREASEAATCGGCTDARGGGRSDRCMIALEIALTTAWVPDRFCRSRWLLA